MRLVWRQMLGILVVIVVLCTTLTISFIGVTNRTLYLNTWRQLSQNADSLINDDEIIFNKKTGQIIGIEKSQIDSKSRMLTRQHVKFAIYDGKHKLRYTNENEYTPTINNSEWQKLKQGKAIQKRTSITSFRKSIARGKQHPEPPEMTMVIKPYFYKGKLVAAVTIGSFTSTMRQNMHQIVNDLLVSFLFAVLIALIISFFVSRSLTQRIDAMNRATRQVAKGDYNVHLENHQKDELDELSHNFNVMARSLQESQEEIKDQEERRQQLLANAAHEMRTPLTTINGILEGLAYDVIPEDEQKHSIELMQQDTKRLIRLVNDNLSYEKIRTNQISLDRKMFDAGAVITNLRDQLAKKAQEKGDELIVTAPPELRVYADYDRFVQILFNIIQNAIQFTDHGKITISGERVTHGTQFSVQDTGIGMTEEQIKHIWERFYKADRSRMNTRYGESGIGMAIVHQLVTLHGGKIKVASKLNKGSTFTVFFPSQQYAPHAGTKKSYENKHESDK
ncbi:HAMP domain-containing histidine kinase [Lactobacillus alvi]|uniref:histidine kinase n=1 Tax=Limosilactobacillus alvi TaxID=990412 RepID=A0ABS2EMC9_9LACO|nr:HAMP domain-containing sensor histidine kinase [Limosilactobacillus alvi]MBM6753664.1 HAMP domain-containing histidine kinase [Limosilactobacillus alvi]